MSTTTATPAPNRQRDILGLIGWFAITIAASALGARASIAASEFYAQLTQPVWAPPAWVFGPVWSILFAMMATAVWLVWRSGGFAANRIALLAYLVQLGLNVLWSWLFFGWQLSGPAFAEVLLLWAAILTTLILFWRIKPLAGVLLTPYLAWVSFASALNFVLWQNNPALLG
ncbi:MAG: TspO/MBR family protein [Pseudomonadota bacterium]